MTKPHQQSPCRCEHGSKTKDGKTVCFDTKGCELEKEIRSCPVKQTIVDGTTQKPCPFIAWDQDPELVCGEYRCEIGGKSSSEKCECKETWKPCIISLKAATQVNAVLDEITKALLSCSWLDDRFSGEGCPGKRDSQKDCDGCSHFDVDISHVHSVIESLRQNTQEGDGK